MPTVPSPRRSPAPYRARASAPPAPDSPLAGQGSYGKLNGARMANAYGINQRIADRLLAEGKIIRGDHQRAVEYATRNRGRIEDALIELEILTEADLLKFIATFYGTRFVSTERLAKAAIAQKVLDKVKAKTADLHGIFPVLFDEAGRLLSVVTADPDNDVALHEVKLAAGVREVKALVARPAAVRAAIAYHYFRDLGAFAPLLRPLSTVTSLVDQNPFDQKRATGPVYQQPIIQHEPVIQHDIAEDFTPLARNMAQILPAAGSVPPPPPGAVAVAVAPAAVVAPQVRPPQHPTPYPPLGVSTILPVMGPGLPQQAAFPPTGVVPQATGIPTVPANATPSPPPVPATQTPEFLETLNVLVSLLENGRLDLRGHSALVARLTRKTCERIGLSPAHTSAYVTAAYLHDLGKMGSYHLTALNVAEYDGHRTAALKAAELPAHLMGSVGLSPETASAMTAMYERYDGQGFPNGQAGKEIPLGARILAVVDTYADLTQNPRNPYRRILRPFEACEVLAQYRGAVFDPNIVDLFRQAMTGEDMRARLLSDRHTVLIVDPDPEETTVLELRLIEQGFEVKIARTYAQAKRDLEAGDVALVVSEIDLDEADAGLALRAEAKREAWGREATWVFLTSKTDRQSAQRAFDLGVDDFVSKPAAVDIFVAKLRQLMDRRAAKSVPNGVSGSLSEMSLPDMVQILWHGRKTCALKIQAQSTAGEIHFVEGQVVNATWGALRGEAAFYRMLALSEGDFRLDPTFVPTSRSITASPEALLLEGMRRLDEGSLPTPV